MTSTQAAKAKLDTLQREDKAAVSNTDIGNFIKRVCTILDEMDSLKEEKKDLMQEIKAAGVQTKELQMTIKEIRKPIDAQSKATVNLYLQQAGQLSLFAE